MVKDGSDKFDRATHCNTLQHTATHCNTLQHTATRCSTLQHTATHCNTLQHTAAHCNTPTHIHTQVGDSYEIKDAKGGSDKFDHIVMATHTNVTLAILGDEVSAGQVCL